MDLAGDSFDIRHINDFAFLQDFNGDFFSSHRMNAKLDLAEGALAEVFCYYVISDGSALLEGRLVFLHVINKII